MPLTYMNQLHGRNTMEIIIAMFLTILKLLTYIVVWSIAAAVVGVLMAIFGLTVIARSTPNTQDDPDLDEGDFEESYVLQPGKRLITSSESARMWRELDRLNDDVIFDKTKDL